MPPPDKTQKGPPPEREAKLAEALRANLRRRKAGASPTRQDARDAKSAGED